MLGIGLGVAKAAAALKRIIRDGLQLWLDFEKNGVDKSANTNNATLYTGKCLSFDGTDDRIDCGNSNSLNPSSEMSALAWVNKDDLTGEKEIIARWGSPASYVMGIDGNGKLFAKVDIGGAQKTVTSPTTIDTSSFVRAGFSYNGSSLKLYENGVEVDSLAVTGTIRQNTSDTVIGALDDIPTIPINAKISDVQLWDKGLSSTDFTFDYNNPQHLATDNTASTLALSNLKGYWHLSEGAGAIAYDSSGQGNNGTISGATWLTAQSGIPQLALMDWSKVGDRTLIADPNDPANDILDNAVTLREHGLNLDGTGYAEIPDHATLDITGDITFGAWIKMGTYDASVFDHIIGNRKDPTWGRIWRPSANNIRLEVTSSDYLTAPATDGAWNYVMATIDSSNNAKLYVNDNAPVTGTFTGSFDWDNTAPLGVGAWLNPSVISSSLANGVIDEPVVYDRVLTVDEISHNYKIGLTNHKTGSSFSDDFSSDYGF